MPDLVKPLKFGESLPGPVAREFLYDFAHEVTGIRGCFGSGKSGTCCQKLFFAMQNQAPQDDLARRTKVAVIRESYPELLSTTIKDFQRWFRAPVGGKLNRDTPISVKIRLPLPDGTRIESEVLFLSMSEDGDESKLAGLSVSFAWVNEARFIRWKHIDTLIGRCNRYPDKDDGGCTWHGVIMDTNPPDTEHWWYDLAEVKRPPTWKFYSQPGGLIRTANGGYADNPRAENIHNLNGGYGYYRGMLVGSTPERIKIKCLNEYAVDIDGRPVWPMYNDQIHCQGKLEVYRGLPLGIGQDFGSTPAAMLMQLSPTGQLRWLREVVTDKNGMGLQQFIDTALKPVLVNEFAGLPITVFGDPAGMQRAQTDERTCFDILRGSGFSVLPGGAMANLFRPRVEAVEKYLLRTDGFRIDPRCEVARRGMLGKYFIERVPVKGGGERLKDEPAKTQESHICEAGQYGTLGIADAGTGGNASEFGMPAQEPVSSDTSGFTDG